ncbi:CRISPR-associated protein, Cmr3 family [Pseudomonas pohangensis]|uniref:CRISPR-associated protein, Cmr3 family n=1 Tax=Pseudomonas pohangensis TaxID=364197 RepID=A0A1H2G1N1_9PSED|nr:type III-B CRISPR module-associated Cmr3 family protein [Pseudomonas pohangensis]SDU13420.1 CRISPR-associated protein, Cmr3 family [Pseudomonas pohangensis]
MSHITCRFEPFDTWFFRESRPQGSMGASELGSVFPPPVGTLLGAVRTLIGDAWHAQNGTTWRQLGDLDELRALIGDSDDLGALTCQGPYLSLDGQRLFPAPANLMVKDEVYFLLGLGEPVNCDLGTIHLPSFPQAIEGLDDLAGAKPADNCWLTSAGWNAILAGQAPAAIHVVKRQQLVSDEPRLGIGRDNSRSAVSHGMLYQTRHLRMHAGVAIELDLMGLPDDLALPGSQVIRLGGEGRQASLSLCKANQNLPPSPTINSTRMALYTLSPTRCAEELPAGIPAGFIRTKANGVDVWEGDVCGLKLRILTVVCSRALREGGWDMARHEARPVTSLLPAGSILFVELLPEQTVNPDQLYSLANGSCVARGRGQLLIGHMPASLF